MKHKYSRSNSFIHAQDAVASAKLLAKKVNDKEAMLLAALLLSRRLASLEAQIEGLEEAIRDHT